MSAEPARRWPKPPPDVVAAGLRSLCEEFMDQYPQVECFVVEPGETPPQGAQRLPAALPLKREPVLDDTVAHGSRQRRADDDPLDQ